MSSPVPGPCGSVTLTVWFCESSRFLGVTLPVPFPFSQVIAP